MAPDVFLGWTSVDICVPVLEHSELRCKVDGRQGNSPTDLNSKWRKRWTEM